MLNVLSEPFLTQLMFRGTKCDYSQPSVHCLDFTKPKLHSVTSVGVSVLITNEKQKDKEQK